jgi:putative nucleotidyltransferase with HDIG domain
LLNPYTQTLEYAASRGFRSRSIKKTRLRLGEGHAGKAALERRIISISNVLKTDDPCIRTQILAGEVFIAHHAVPLIAKGQVKGVLEVFHRSQLVPDPEWLEFFESLAAQAAIAIDNASLFDELQRSNTELTLAYDTTLEGWSHALDMRDRETEGHTIRVAEMTLQLARSMGMSDIELEHIRRGALLHDIGKMGIPDTILLKPGPLSTEEYQIMCKHPVYAYNMLSSISFLRQALTIPYCHHERWDGTGYPRGLSGEQIPLEARIFAVVDVWDALRSDRPYRSAWTEEKALDFIREHTGKYFDPKVVEAFLKIVK